jgi:DNA polymerase
VLPRDLLDLLFDPEVTKTAYNAAFERVCLRAAGYDIPVEQWRCTSVLALQLGLPGHLADVAKALRLPQDKQKMTAGKRLIRKFCIPQKRRKTGEVYWIAPADAPAEWETFKEYCRQDVVVEREIRNKLLRWQPLPVEQQTYNLDQKINDAGWQVDTRLVERAMEADAIAKARFEAEAIALTGLSNPNSVSQLKTWLEDETLTEVESLTKETLPGLLKDAPDATVRRVLELRGEMSKTSVKKYKAIQNMVGRDGRARGLLKFYGANRTGRWAGTGPQIQNLKRSSLKTSDLTNARDLLLRGDYQHIEVLYGSVPDVLSQLVRTAFIAPPGQSLTVIDFSAIEARMLAWLAQETWRLGVFNTHGKIYEASASEMFKVPLERIKKGNPEYALRQKGKISELALGYGGSVGALTTMGALKMGLTEDELPPLVRAWRAANTKVCDFWWRIGDAAFEAVADKTAVAVTYVKGASPIVFSYESGFLFLTLPSGRRLAYVRPRIEKDERFGKDGVTYEGLNQETKQWQRIQSYGPKWVENLTQAACRDLLRDSMIDMDAAGHKIVAHVHDEVITETDALEQLEVLMGKASSWAPGLPLKGDGFVSSFYRKGD